MRSQKKHKIHELFLPLIVLTLVLWFLYRRLFMFPVWFDETIGKAIFFGLPAWLYVTSTGFREVIDTFSTPKLKPGLLRGLAVGGLFGFITLFFRLWQRQGSVLFVPVFFADAFWWEAFLALCTAFWETLFFFSFVMSVIQDRFEDWKLSKQVTATSLIFMLFHIPNIFLRFSGEQVIVLLLLLTLFSVGQALLFARNRNAYTLILSHTLWGLSLLIYW
jgi:hypothetical protein